VSVADCYFGGSVTGGSGAISFSAQNCGFIDVNGKAGSIRASITGTLGEFGLNAGSGDVNIDLSGATLTSQFTGVVYINPGPRLLTYVGASTAAGDSMVHNETITISGIHNWHDGNSVRGGTGANNILYFTGGGSAGVVDLTKSTINNINTLELFTNTYIVNSATFTGGVTAITGSGVLVTSGARLDLTSVLGNNMKVNSTALSGTVFDVASAAVGFTVQGGLGSDVLVGHGFVFSANQRGSIFATTSIEAIVDSSGSYTARGLYVTGSSSADQLVGGQGDDLILGGGGADILTGGAGSDTFLYKAVSDSTGSAADLITDFATALDVIDLAAVTPSSVSIIRSGEASFIFASTASGSMMIDVSGAVNGGDISWGAGHAGVYLVGDNAGDQLLGGSLGDSIHGGSGNDLIVGGAGADGLFGGAGADTFKYTAISDSTATATDLILDFQTGSDKIDLTALGINHISTIDNGSAEFVFIETTSGASMQINFVGADAIQAGDFNVTGGTNFYIQGDSGANILIGGAGKDVIDGHDGNDLIIGGGGSDALFGGAGNDTFKYLAASDSSVSAADTIFDFQTGVDKIDLTGVHAAGVGSYGIAYTATGSYLFVDVNGDGVNDMLIQFTNPNLHTSDILF
jgi:Ca2+-binding RTX toxin-like protein